MELIRTAHHIHASPEQDVALIAIGDIHGQFDLFLKIIEAARKTIPSTAKRVDLVLLGDLIDRGPGSVQLLDFLQNGIKDWNIIPLLGNHEQSLLHLLQSDEERYHHFFSLWIGNGGLDTLHSAGRELPTLANSIVQEQKDVITEILNKKRIAYIDSFKSHYRSGTILCVHGGIDPNITIEENFRKDRLSTHPNHWAWMRLPFLDHHGPFEAETFIVHGHTVIPGPKLEPHRIGLDTGACVYGVLSGATFYNSEMTIFQVTAD